MFLVRALLAGSIQNEGRERQPKATLLIPQQRIPHLRDTRMAGKVYKLVHSSYIITIHKSQRTRITLVKKEAASPQNIVQPFLLKPYAVPGMQQFYSLIHTLQTQQKDQGHGTGMLSL
jgi:hypothetical protein